MLRTDFAYGKTQLTQIAIVSAYRDDPKWRDEYHHFEDGFTSAPVFDDDDFYFNGILHPLVGSEYYLMARNQGWSGWRAVAYSVGMSACFEYLVENTIQHPSATDLLVTPLIGSLLGESRYRLKLWLLKDAEDHRGRQFLAAVIDDVWSRQVQRFWLHTCEFDHARAVDVYRSRGLQVYEETDEPVPSPESYLW